GIHKADEQPIVVKLPYEIENQGLYTDPKEKGIIGALGESVWQGVKSNGTAFVNNMDTLAYRGLEKQKKEAEKYLSNHDDLVSEIYKKNIDKFGENGSYADFLKKNIVENTQKPKFTGNSGEIRRYQRRRNSAVCRRGSGNNATWDWRKHSHRYS
ncbi:MAG: hypothetical protein RR253_04495, partial [Oscillospiraceae bacterium]